MTDTVVLAIIGIIAPTVASVGAVMVSLRNGTKTDTVIAKTELVHTLVNSNLTAVKDALSAALERIKKLEDLLIRITGKLPEDQVMRSPKEKELLKKAEREVVEPNEPSA